MEYEFLSYMYDMIEPNEKFIKYKIEDITEEEYKQLINSLHTNIPKKLLNLSILNLSMELIL